MKNLKSLTWLGAALALAAPAIFADDAAPPPPLKSTGDLAGRLAFGGAARPPGLVATDAIVWLVGDRLSAAPGRAKPPVLDQRDITFVPRVVPVLVGTTLKIRNSDAILHNVRTISQENAAFNKVTSGGQKLEEVFSKPEIIPVVCDMHSQMRAYLVVVPNRYFARAAADGSFVIPNIPPGKYELVAWHELFGPTSAEVEVTRGTTTNTDLTLVKDAGAAASATVAAASQHTHTHSHP